MKRRLSDTEKRKIREEHHAVECARSPGYFVDIIVRDETDDNGDPVLSVLRSREYANIQIGCKFG